VQYLLKVAEKTDNLVIKADALHYKTDLWSNAAVLVALGLVSLTGLDTIVAFFCGDICVFKRNPVGLILLISFHLFPRWNA